MDFEKLTYNKLKIIFTNEELLQWGLSVETIWLDTFIWNELMEEMHEIVRNELGLETIGTIAIEITSHPNQGMALILTIDDESDDCFLEEEIVSSLPMYQMTDSLFEFMDIEDVIQLSHRLIPYSIGGGSLYFLHGKYFLRLTEDDISPSFEPLVEEYGIRSKITTPVLLEYGKCLLENDAIKMVVSFFF